MAAGCARPPVDTLAPAGDAEGLYYFSASVATSQGGLLLEGSFEVAQDTIVMSMQQADCVAQPGPRPSYQCQATGLRGLGPIRFTFERIRPLRPPTLSFALRIPFEERVCARYQSTTEGRVCISWSVKTTYRTEQHTVRPTVTRAPAPAPSHIL